MKASPAVAAAGDPADGRANATPRAVRHGQNGLSTAPEAPSLPASPSSGLRAPLRAYRSGARKHEVMGVVAKVLGDDDLDNLAARFGSLKVSVAPP